MNNDNIVQLDQRDLKITIHEELKSMHLATQEQLRLTDEKLSVRIDGLDKRIDGLDKRIDGLTDSINTKFDSVNAKFDSLYRLLLGFFVILITAVASASFWIGSHSAVLSNG
ncbi:hypothetical protein [Vibrio mediterranei]|uniref:hypothetical protein n=1 Tax=Vibrio mediterranei TaxID=689 RepID=UPI00148DEEAA|nr:hypothetical protein [Vibrio mediterranei]NOI26983.1 hypothetical protein [Vibrio mediterranei]